MRTRRFLPSISLLSAFEAVLRTGSTAAASRELNLTQSTVSRLVQNLEQQLGRPLFERAQKRLVPTITAHAYGYNITRALLGVALLLDYAAEHEIREQRLMPVFRQSIQSSGSYRLSWPIGTFGLICSATLRH